MAIRVDNLNNLFWDNGSSRFPNTHPFLVNGKYLENTTPVMTSPTTGWVVLTGDFNYCEYKGELFFLKKDARISEKKNKWRYILIKDHVCTLFKNKANVLIKGTLTNTSLDKLNDTDFQFTLSVFNNFNKRILLPLNKQVYNWKKHIIPIAPNKEFDDIYSIDNKDYSIFLRQLENNKRAFQGYKFEKANDFTLLGRAKLSRKQHNWKNELVKKIKELLESLNTDDVILARFGSDYGGGEILRNKYTITYNSYSLGAHVEEFKQVLDLDLSGLTDIELISAVTGTPTDYEKFNLTLKEVQIDESRDAIIPTFIKKLARRNRVSFISEYTTRAIYEKNEKLYTWFEYKDNREFWYPQKVFFKIKPSLLAKSQWQRNLPTTRKFEAYRSVYLYSIKNLNFVYRFSTGNGMYWRNYEPYGTNFIDPDLYLTDNSNKALSKNYCYTERGVKVVSPNYEDYAPWKKLKEPINIGWLIGQFSPFLKDNEEKFEKDKPFIVKAYFTSLYRIIGLQDIVSKLIQNEDAYEPPTALESKNLNFTLDIFNKLPLRARKATSEEDFLIGEKLLFTTWGLASYILFQPIKDDGYDYTIWSLDKDNSLLARWLTGANWFYYYNVFDEGHYVSNWAKQWFKMGYSDFQELHYERFYENDNNYRNLKTHIKRNTEAYFKSSAVDFTRTPIKECKIGDIFFSDLDYYFYSYDEFSGKPDLTRKNYDWYTHTKDAEAELRNGEVVVYHDIQSGKLAIGKTYVWDAEITLPEGQFIEEGRVNSDSSSNNIQRSKVTRITKIAENDTFDEIINVVRNRPQELFKNIIDFTLEDLKGKGYLFDLKGTDFWCYLDARGRAHLIFKKDSKVKVNKKQIYAIGATEAIEKLSKVHWVNQKVNLSIFGHKVELPIKAFANRIIVTIELDTADLERRTNEALDSHKVEITHALGKTYLRFDTSKMNTLGTAQFNIFDIARTDIANMRSSQDYLIRRREYEINNAEMQLEHRHMRFENQMQKNALITETILGGIGAAVSGVGGIGLAVSSGLAKLTSSKVKSAGAATRIGLGMGIKSMTGSLGLIGDVIGNSMKWSRFEEQTKMMEERIGFQIEKKARESYNIDLGFQRQKDDYEFNLRQTFSQQNIHQASSRERNLALDDKEADLEGLSRKEDKEIYLELWTISDKQKEFVEEYHKEYGVDCRVAHSVIPFGNGMKQGVYRMEQVELLNLTDRIDLLLIKALFENGIKIVEWIEHEKVKELIPEDPRIAKLERQIEEANRLKEQLEQEKHLLDVKIQELTVAIQNSKDEATRLTDELTNKKKELEETLINLDVTSKQLQFEVEKYDSLATGYRQLEEAKATEERLKNLYLDETKKQRESINLIERQKSDLEKAQKTQENLYKALVLQERQKSSQISRLNTQIKNLSAKIKDCEAREVVLFREKSESNEALEKLRKDNQELQAKVIECAGLEEKASRVEEAEAKLNNIEEEKKALTAQIDSQLLQIQEKEKTITALREIGGFDKANMPNPYVLSLTSHLQKTYIDYGKNIYTRIVQESDKGFHAIHIFIWSDKFRIFMLSHPSNTYRTITIKKLWAYRNDSRWGSSATEIDMGYFWKFDQDDVKKGFKKMWEYAPRVTNSDTALNRIDSAYNSYDNSIYVGEWNVLMTQYLGFMPAIFCSEEELIEKSNTEEIINNQELRIKIFFHKEKGWANSGNKDSKYKDVPEEEIITLTTYKNYLDFFGWKWDNDKKKVVPKI